METDSGFQMRLYCCSVEWLTTCSNLDEYALKLYSDDKYADFFFILLVINLLSPRVSSLFLSRLGGALKIDLP